MSLCLTGVPTRERSYSSILLICETPFGERSLLISPLLSLSRSREDPEDTESASDSDVGSEALPPSLLPS